MRLPEYLGGFFGGGDSFYKALLTDWLIFFPLQPCFGVVPELESLFPSGPGLDYNKEPACLRASTGKRVSVFSLIHL